MCNLCTSLPFVTKVLLSSRLFIVVRIEVTAEAADGGGEGGSRSQFKKPEGWTRGIIGGARGAEALKNLSVPLWWLRNLFLPIICFFLASGSNFGYCNLGSFDIRT